MSSENHIPGIHNWCDRWCEKCAFIRRCAVGAMELEMLKDDGDPEAFLEQMFENMEKTGGMMEEFMEEEGIDFEEHDPEFDAKFEAAQNLEKIIRDTHPLTNMANKYAEEGRIWLESEDIKQFEERIPNQKIPDLEELGMNMSYKECMEIIHYYLFFIAVKSERMIAEAEDDFWDEVPVYERSFNGTAKITLIAVERSLMAWLDLMQIMTDHKECIMANMANLTKLKKLIEAHFPDAHKFKRPGFDD